MSTSTAINPKGPRLAKPLVNACAWFDTYIASTVGLKIVVALTGLGLTSFAFFHMLGNLKMFQGPEAINHYARFLKHDLGMLIWIARGGLLGIFLLHLLITIRLKMRSSSARPVGYSYQVSAQATAASKSMIWTGLVVGAFIAFHLAHYTFGIAHSIQSPGGGWKNYLELEYTMPDGTKVHNVYAMVVAGFTTTWISVVYILAQLLLFVHLSHGIPSTFQTLGLKSRRFTNAIRLAGLGLALVIVGGNILIVAAVWSGVIPATP